MDLVFRKLRADEIDIRVAQISEKGASLLLYKDARCDMNILDETVGAMGWMRQHSRENANCTVSLWDKDKQMWISKEDTGTESNTEAEKGLASDSFKRACFNWGIGRELYTAPFIWVPAGKVSISQGRNGKPATFDKFTVKHIDYDGNAISALEIINDKGATVYTFAKGKQNEPAHTEQKPPKKPVTNDDASHCSCCHKPIADHYYDDGAKVFRAAKIIGRAKELYGKCMCYECLQKAVNDDAPNAPYDERAMQEIA